MVYIYNKLSPNEASPPPISQQPPTSGAGSYTQMPPRNQSQKRLGKHQFQQPPPGYHMAAMNFMVPPQHPVNVTPPQFPPVTNPPHQLPPVNLESVQGPPEGFIFGQQPPAGFIPQQQPPVVDMSMQPYSTMNFDFQQGPQEFPMQQGIPPIEFMVSPNAWFYIFLIYFNYNTNGILSKQFGNLIYFIFQPPEVMFGIQAQFMSAPIYAPETNLMPFNGTVPPPGFEPSMAFAAENPNYQYDANNALAVNGKYNST